MAIKKETEAYSGVIGEVVMYTAHGKPALRTRPRKRKNTSEKVKMVNGNFAHVLKFVKLMKQFYKHGYESHAVNRIAYHVAMSENLNSYNEALRLGTAEDLSWLKLSKGKLSKALESSASISPNGEIRVTWNGTEPGREFNNYDYLMLMIYNHRDSSCLINLQQAFRKDGETTILLDKAQSGDKIDVIIAFSLRFLTEKKNIENVSDSQWVGQVVK